MLTDSEELYLAFTWNNTDSLVHFGKTGILMASNSHTMSRYGIPGHGISLYFKSFSIKFNHFLYKDCEYLFIFIPRHFIFFVVLNVLFIFVKYIFHLLDTVFNIYVLEQDFCICGYVICFLIFSVLYLPFTGMLKSSWYCFHFFS